MFAGILVRFGKILPEVTVINMHSSEQEVREAAGALTVIYVTYAKTVEIAKAAFAVIRVLSSLASVRVLITIDA